MPRQVSIHHPCAIDHLMARGDRPEVFFLDGAKPTSPRGCAVGHPPPKSLPCGNDRKALIALAIKRETTGPRNWLGSQLHMATRSTVSRVTAAMARRLAEDKKLAQQHHLIVKGAS